MKLCQKCIDTIKEYFGISYDFPTVPERECEFWAHKAIIKIGTSIDVTTIDGKKKIFGEVIALSVNEVVDGFAMITVEPK